jgi:dipeptidyl aminopeptidase/acylaminoacyl peptidase
MISILLTLVATGTVVLAEPKVQDSGKHKKPSARTEPGTLTVELAIAVRRPSDLQFSPDGRRLAFSVSRPPKAGPPEREIWMLDVASHKLWRYAHSFKSDHTPRWSPGGKQLAFLSDRREQTQIYVMPTDGGEAEPLTEGKNAIKAFEWSPDGKQIAFLAPEPKTEAEEKKEKDKDDARVVDLTEKPTRLWVVDLASKKARQLTRGKWQVAGVKWAPQGNRLFVAATEHPESLVWRTRLCTIALADGAMREIHAPRGPISNLEIAPDGKALTYLAARGDGPVPHDLFFLSLDGAPPRNLTAGSLDRPIEGYSWQRDGRVLATVADGFRSRLFALTPKGKANPVAPMNINPVGRAVRSRSGQLAFVGQTATDPVEIYTLASAGRPERQTDFNGALRKVGLIQPEYYRYTSFDKEQIEAALYRPRLLPKGKPAPVVVLIHGGPTGRWADGVDSLCWPQLLAANGYAAFCPNVRGSTGYGWKFLVKNRADWGGGDFKDIMAGVDDLVHRGIADPKRLGIAGWSYGGYMSAWAITQTRRFKAAVVGAGMSDLASEFGTETLESAQYDHWFFGVPYEKGEGFLKRSPVTHLKNARTPTLILHGEKDPIDPLGQAQQLHRGLKHYGSTCEFVIYPRAGHGLQEEKHLLDLERRLLRWFDTHMK